MTAASSDFAEIVVESVADGLIDRITIDRPAARNALTLTTYRELTRAVTTSSARCIIITGTDPAFCSGDDVRQVMTAVGESTRRGDRPIEPQLTPTAAALFATDIPVIAAVNGPAVGWGMELALLADIRIASDRARFGELFVARGLCCDVPGLVRLASLVGRERAAELLFTGRVIDADEAVRIGLVSRVVEHAAVNDTAEALAHQIAAQPPRAVAAIKRGLRRALDPDVDDLGRWVSTTLGELFATDDHREAVSAYLERRPGIYRGR